MNSHPRLTGVLLAGVLFLGTVSACTAQSNGSEGNFTAYTQETSDPSLEDAYSYLTSTNMLEEFAEILTSNISVPTEVVLTSRQCGVQNAFFKPRSEFGHPMILFCYEMVEDIIEEFQYEDRTEESIVRAVTGTVAFILLHEVGHALIRLNDVPITGREEDVVDQFATLLLIDQPQLLLGAAQYFEGAGDFGDLGLRRWFQPEGTFGDEHSLGKQRFYNILCWTYGKDPSNRSGIIRNSFLPTSRARQCRGEFERMKRGLSETLGPYVAEIE